VRMKGEPVNDGRHQSRVADHLPHSENGKLVAVAALDTLWALQRPAF